MKIEKRARALLRIGMLMLLTVTPNALWLERSTLRIENRSASPLEALELRTCGERLPVGSLAAGASRLQLLPKCGEATLTLASEAAALCTLYVEGSMYHVHAWATSAETGDCSYGSPPFSPLLSLELLRSMLP